jgi:TPR repeat protein
VIFAARDEATLKALGPQYWEGKRFRPISFSAVGRDGDYVALRTDVAEPDDVGANPYQSAYWSYVSTVFTRSFPQRLPAWYSRGIAEVMSNTIVREKEVHVGRPMRGNLEILNQRPAIPLDEFLSADYRSHWLTQEGDVSRFDAQAWAFVHYLIFADKGAHAERLNRFGTLLINGSAPELALKEAFGDMSPYHEQMRSSVHRALFAYMKAPLMGETRREAYQSRSLSAGEAAALRGQLLVAMRRPLEARAAAAVAAKADPSLPGPSEIEAELLDSEGKPEEAKAAFAKAVESGSRRAHVHYRLAQLEWTPGADKALLERLAGRLEKARQLEPESGRTLSFLADVRADLEQNDEAFALAKRAVEIEPAASYHRATLARVLWRLGRADESAQAARTALKTADSDSERQRAQEFLDFLARVPRPRSAANASDAPVAPRADSSPAAPIRLAVGAAALKAISACFANRDDKACGEAAPLLESTCESGRSEACRSLGSLYDGGFGVKQDKARAGAAYDRGCRGGDKPSCARYAVLQVHGEGVARDTSQGLATLQRLCTEGVDDGCLGWAVVLAATRGKEELAKARELLQPPCDRGHQEACRLLKSLR